MQFNETLCISFQLEWPKNLSYIQTFIKNSVQGILKFANSSKTESRNSSRIKDFLLMHVEERKKHNVEIPFFK